MRLLRWFTLLILLAVAVAAVSLRLPFRGFAGETFVDIPRGTSSAGVARLLADAGVIRYGWQFLGVRLIRLRAKIQAGEYRFQQHGSAWDIFDRLAKGDVFYYQLTVPEGFNLFDIANALDKLGAITGREFLAAARDPSPIRDLAPEARTLEGYLFPDTYRITKRTTAGQLCAQMTERFRHAWQQLDSSQPVHRTVTLASLVEEEAVRAEERPLVASVFVNRLALGMPLDCDPTAIYAALLEGRYRGEIYRDDLESRSLYNTYQHGGLPPGPITNPGIESLKAALQPAETHYLYFVARPDGSGAHAFSEKLEAHQRAVIQYRRGNHKANQTRASQPVPRRNPARTSH
ncbi:MAG: endolytic transglycosylase MltG [Acidobacteriales bacterium]|nr:MAG: endolytic transglycosylase MltG [Terriglobales bacterium]